ncbi:hypothetical protein [Streptomyces sp. NPDC055058]
MSSRRGWNGHPTTLSLGSCPTCGKAMYISRVVAKRAAKGMFPGLRHRPVQCGQRWHIELVRGAS